MRIEQIESAQFEQVTKLLKQLGYDVTVKELDNRVEVIRINKGNVFVALDDDEKIVGCVHALIDTRLAGGTFGEIVSLVVDESVRGKGIGKLLIDAAESWVRSNGMHRLRVRCNSKRDDTHKFYAHLGFVEKKSQKIFERPI